MHRLKRLVVILAATLLSLGALCVLFGLLFTDFLVDEWWFRSLGYDFYFWQRLLYRYLVFAGFTFLFFLVIFLNFWMATRFLGQAPRVKPSRNRGRASDTGSYWSSFGSSR